MLISDLIMVLSRLLFGAMATFFAILLWSKTRDIAWVLVIIGTLISYAEIVYITLEKFGLVGSEMWQVQGVPVFKLLLVNLPMVFFTAAFITIVFRKRYR